MYAPTTAMDLHRIPRQVLEDRVDRLKAAGISDAPAPTSTGSSRGSMNLKKDGRVFYPMGYGADPSGEQDSSDAILDALKDAFRVGGGSILLPGVSDLGGVVIDFQGGNYSISKPIRFLAQSLKLHHRLPD